MAQSHEYRKPRNGELRDLLVHLPYPVKVIDPSGLLLWQNGAAERLDKDVSIDAWLKSSTAWQGKKAQLATPNQERVESPPSSQLAELEAENDRLRRHQRQTARRKKKAEDTAKQSERAVDDVAKRELKLRAQLEEAERRLAELEEATRENLTPEETPPGKVKGKSKAKSKAKARGKGGKAVVSLAVEPEALNSSMFEAEYRALEGRHVALQAEIEALRARGSELEAHGAEQDAARTLLERDLASLGRVNAALEARLAGNEADKAQLEADKAQLEEDKRQLEAWIEELEAESTPPSPTSSIKESAETEALAAGAAQAEELRVELEAERARFQEEDVRAQARYSELKAEYASFRQQTEEQESARLLEEQLAAKVREFEELERTFEDEQKAYEVQKRELELRLSEQEGEFRRLKDTVTPSKEMPAAPVIDAAALEELREDLEEAKTAIVLATRREVRLAEKLESANELKEEQSKVLALVKDELGDLRTRERELKETLQLYGEFRPQLEQARSDAKKYRAEAEELRATTEALEARIREMPAALPPSAGLKLRDGGASDSGVKGQLEFAQNRLRDTEKQLDESREALKKAKAEGVSAKDTEKLAFQDSLTGLPNRHIVDRYLDFAHKQARSTNQKYALFLIDIDGFRVLNETFGRDWGDSLLKAVGERLAGMRGSSHVFARHSQDRFLLLAANLARPGAEQFVQDASKSLLEALAHPFDIKGETIKLTGSIGIAMGPGSLEDPRALFAQAEVALMSAKASGVGGFFLHNEALLQKAQRDSTYMRQMEQAIDRKEFQAVYQPIFNLNKGQVTGLELLLRWNHRDQRTLRPDEFLEVALRSGLIFKLTEAIWPTAFKALARWRRLRPGVTLSINLSDRELLSPDLVARAVGWAASAGVEPSAILFEVRDASRLRLSAAWWNILGEIHKLGFGLILDDYGSDASLFGTLAYQGFSQAKIAVDEKNPVCTPSPNAARGVLYCAKRIQTRFDQKVLKKAGFDLAQGLAVARPIDEADVDEVLAK